MKYTTSTIAIGVLALSTTAVLANGTVKKTEHVHYPCPPRHHATVVETTPCPPERCIRDGGIIGVHAGYERMHGRIQNNFIQTAPAGLAQNVSQSGGRHDNKAFGGILVGWRHIVDNAYSIGFDVAGDLTNGKVKQSFAPNANLPLGVSFKRKYEIIPSLSVGRVFNPCWHGFIKVGLGISRFKTRLHNVNAPQNFKSATTKYGVVPAIGLEYALSKAVSATGTVAYEYYPRVHRHFNNIVPGGVSTNKISTRPYFITAKLGLLFKI
jgi:hypothetical protein